MNHHCALFDSIAMTTLLRTKSSSVVVLKDDSVMEIRRVDAAGAALAGHRTWKSQTLWLAEVGEPLLPDSDLSDDMKLMISLARRYCVCGEKPNLFVGCEDGDIRGVYYNPVLNTCGIYLGSGDHRIGRTFEELGIQPVAWYIRDDAAQTLRRIKDSPCQWDLV